MMFLKMSSWFAILGAKVRDIVYFKNIFSILPVTVLRQMQHFFLRLQNTYLSPQKSACKFQKMLYFWRNKQAAMKKTLLLLTCLATTYVNAQSLAPQVISSAGTSFTDGVSQLDWTLGETVTQTFTDGTTILSQGFE